MGLNFYGWRYSCITEIIRRFIFCGRKPAVKTVNDIPREKYLLYTLSHIKSLEIKL